MLTATQTDGVLGAAAGGSSAPQTIALGTVNLVLDGRVLVSALQRHEVSHR